MSYIFFDGFIEVERSPQFRNNNPVSLDQFKRIIGGYKDERDDLLCQLHKPSGTCRHKHNEGVVIELKDGSWSNIGWICANTHFKHDERFKQERRTYKAAKDAMEALKTLTLLLEEKTMILRELRMANENLGMIDSSINRLFQSIPSKARNFLSIAAKTGKTDVFVHVEEKVKIEVRGKVQEQTRWREEKVGSIHGIEVWGQRRRKVKESIAEIIRCFEMARVDQSLPAKVISSWNKTLASWKSALSSAQDLLNSHTAFIDRQNLTLLCTQVVDIRERREMAAIAQTAKSIESWTGDRSFEDVGRQSEQNFYNALKDRFKADVRFI